MYRNKHRLTQYSCHDVHPFSVLCLETSIISFCATFDIFLLKNSNSQYSNIDVTRLDEKGKRLSYSTYSAAYITYLDNSAKQNICI